jgi:hypothetical protein
MTLPGSNRAILGAKELPFISQWVVGVSKTILKRERQEILSKAVERGQKVSHFLISLSIVSSNDYSDFYLRHAFSTAFAKLPYRP